MAAFNPPVPEADPRYAPDFVNLSRPLTGFDIRGAADKSKGIAMEGLGKALVGATDSAYNVIDSTMKREAEKRLTPVMDDWTSRLETATNTPSTVQGGPSLLPKATQTDDAPGEIKSGIDQIATLHNAGKVKPELKTLISGQVASIQKELRSKYPGFRSQVDAEVTRITGGINANEHLRDLETQIAAADQTKQSFTKEIATKLIDLTAQGNGVSYGVTAKGLMDGTVSVDKAIEELSKGNKQLHDYKLDEARVNVKIKNKEDASGDAEMAISKRATGFFDNIFHGVMTSGSAISDESYEQYLQGVAAGTIKNDPVVLNQIADALEARKSQAITQLRQMLTSAPPGQESMYTALHNPEKFDKIMQDAASQYTQNINLIRNKEGGLAFALSRNTTSIQTRAENGILNDPKIGPFAQQIPALRKVFGDTKQFADFIDKYMVNPKVAEILKGRFQDYGTALTSSNGQVSFDQVIKDATSIAKTSPAVKALGPQVMARTYTEVLNLSDYLDKGPNDNAKRYLAKSMYGSNNYNLIDNFNQDHQADVFNQFTSKGKVDAIDKLGDPKLAKAQKDWGEVTFFKLYKGSLGEIKDILQGDNNLLSVKWNGDSGHWDVKLKDDPELNQTQRFVKGLFPADKIRDTIGTFIQSHAAGYERVHAEVDKLNSAIDQMKYLEEKRGGNIQDFMFQTLRGMGVTPKNINTDNSIEAQMARSILSAHRGPEPETVDPFNTKTKSKSQDRP
jgi:hypothetical protein